MFCKHALIALSCGLLVAGCNKPADTAATTSQTAGQAGKATPGTADHNIAGTWTGTKKDVPEFNATFDFKDDGTFEETALAPVSGLKEPLKSLASGTYTVSGKSITIKIEKVNMTHPDPRAKDSLDEQNATMAKKLPIDSKGELAWTDNDNAVLTTQENGKPVVVNLHRGAAPAGDKGAPATSGG